jgi:hypothetical protein
MATGRIGVTPVLRTRWSDQPTVGTTSLSGLDDNSVSLVYDVGYEAVYRNGVLLSRGNDYTATDGTTVTLIDATLAGDIIEIFANELVPLTDAIGKGQYNAKGALLSATAASTPGVLAVGANDTVLTADSTEATGLKWATPAAGGMTLLSTTSLTGASVTLSSIPATYNNLQVVIFGVTNASSDGYLRIAPNGATTSCNNQFLKGGDDLVEKQTGNYITLTSPSGGNLLVRANANNTFVLNIFNYASSTAYKNYQSNGIGRINATDNLGATILNGVYFDNTAISSLVISNSGGDLSTGTCLLYGVK